MKFDDYIFNKYGIEKFYKNRLKDIEFFKIKIEYIIKLKNFHHDFLGEEIEDIFCLFNSYYKYAVSLEKELERIRKEKQILLKKYLNLKYKKQYYKKQFKIIGVLGSGQCFEDIIKDFTQWEDDEKEIDLNLLKLKQKEEYSMFNFIKKERFVKI